MTDTFAKFQDLRFPIRGLVACAGVSDDGPATEFPADSFRRLLDINVTGTFLVAQATAREVVKHNTTASMVLVASMSGYVSNKVCCIHLNRYYCQTSMLSGGPKSRVSIRPAIIHPRPLSISLPGHLPPNGVLGSPCR